MAVGKGKKKLASLLPKRKRVLCSAIAFGARRGRTGGGIVGRKGNDPLIRGRGGSTLI